MYSLDSTLIVLVGRFAPFCNVHLARVRAELARTGKAIVLITGADASRSSRLPWTADEREVMCRSALTDEGDRVMIFQTDDHPYDDTACIKAWAAACRDVDDERSLLFGAEMADRPELRTAFFEGDDETLQANVPPSVLAALKAFRQSDRFEAMTEEHRYVEAYKASWAAAPYPPIFVTVDTVIVHHDPKGAPHVLLIRRGGQPGRGLYALPGGFVEAEDTLIAAAIRELREETGLSLSDDGAMMRLLGQHVFDDPQRSARGRTITHAFHFVLPAGVLPKVEGLDDAASAQWVPVHELATLRGRFFEDHGHILVHFLKL